MLPEVESVRVQSLWLLKKPLPSREEPDISSSIVNSKARFYTRALLARSEVALFIHLAMILFTCSIYLKPSL